jgi:hypothetical protein
LFSDHDLHAQSKPATPSLYQTSFTVTSFTPSTASSRLRDLAPETNQARTQGFLSSTTWLNGNWSLKLSWPRIKEEPGGSKAGFPAIQLAMRHNA